MSKTIAVIDGDEICFKIAAACETRSILVTNKGNSQASSFKHRTEFKKFLEGVNVPSDFFDVVDVQTPEDIANCFHSVKVVIEKIKKACGADEIEVYLSGKDNFRDSIPLPSKYKGSRADTLRPVLLEDVRKYMKTKYHAKIVDGCEVDDVVCERMYTGYTSEQKIIGVTCDKDACGSVGWLFNPDKMLEPIFIDGLGSLWLEV